MYEKIYQPQWMSLSRESRQYLAKVFSIPKSGITEIRDNEVISDGYTNEDLSAITGERMAALVGYPIESDFFLLWKATISKATLETTPVIEILDDSTIVVETQPVVKYCDTCASTKGRHRKGCPKYK